MGRTSYLIAKYVSDLFRNEPVNIGVIVWSDGATAWRFLGAKEDGSVDGRKLRGRISSLDAYKQWVAAWVKLLSKDRISFIGRAGLVPKADPAFLDALESTGRGNYILERGGELLEDVQGTELRGVVDYLFSRLVDIPNEPDDSKSAEEVRDELLIEAHVGADPRVKIDQRVPIDLGGDKIIRPEFHLYIGNGKPEWLAQVLPITAQPKEVRKTAESIAWRFDSVIRYNKLEKGRAVAIVYSTEPREDDMIDESLVELGTVAKILDLRSSRTSVLQAIQQWVKSTELH